MSFPLLLTKFNIPSPGTKVVQRGRLLQLLDESLEQPASLVLVSGPAGYGKTTIISEWLQVSEKAQGYPYAWLTLERGDDDLPRFVTYFVTALQRIFPGIGEGMLKMLQTHKPSPVPILATLLINELNAISKPFILVLDDYHLLTSNAIHSFISFLVDHQPRQMGLVLITRADPELPLARMRAKGQLVELRQNDLCFTPDEVAAYIRRTMGIELPPEQITFLANQTEGWIAGLQLAVISLRKAPDRSAFFKAFSGDHAFIADYLTDEVLVRLDEPLRGFLLRTSILDRLSASLCEAVTGQTGTQEMLKHLAEANLFIATLDNQHAWYRYHPLFADLLRKRLHQERGISIPDLHRRASTWYENAKVLDLAIEHAIAGGDDARAGKLIEQVAEPLLMRGEALTLLHWMEALPAEVILSRPRLGSLYGFALMLCGRSTEVVHSLIKKMNRSEHPGEFQGEMMMLQGLLAIMRGTAQEAIRFSKLAIEQLPPDQVFFHSLAADSLGMGYTLAGDIPMAIHAFEQVVEISSQSENAMMTIMGLTNLAGLQYYQGQLQAGIASCRQVLNLAEAHIGRQSPVVGKALLNLGEMLREQGDYETAFHHFSEAAEMMENFVEIGLPVAYLSLAKLKMNQKDWEAAQEYIDQARQQAQMTQSTQMDDILAEIAQARLWVGQGELTLASGWAQARGFLDESHVEKLTGVDQNIAMSELAQSENLVLARLFIAKGQLEQAHKLVGALYNINQTRSLKWRQVELLALKAVTLHLMGETEPALETLSKALHLGEPEGYHTVFVDEGEPMAQLLYQAVARNISPSYASKLLKALSGELSKALGKKTQPDELIEPLSDRELEVLKLLAEGLSNRKITQKLNITLSTVKGHNANIYGKLGVNNRTQAVAQARSLGLLPND